MLARHLSGGEGALVQRAAGRVGRLHVPCWQGCRWCWCRWAARRQSSSKGDMQVRIWLVARTHALGATHRIVLPASFLSVYGSR